MTMVTVKLFKMALRKKVKADMLRKSFFLESVSSNLVTTRKPYKANKKMGIVGSSIQTTWFN